MREKLKKVPVTALCYVIAAVIWLCHAGACAAGAAALKPWQPELSDFILDGINIKQGDVYGFQDAYVSVHGDPWMLYPQKVTISGLSFRLRGLIATGTPEIYVRKEENQPFHSIPPTTFDPATGTYVFDTGLLRDVQLRIDPATTSGCLFEISDLTLNPGKNTASYFVPKLHELVILAVVPALCGMFISELCGCMKKKKDEKPEEV